MRDPTTYAPRASAAWSLASIGATEALPAIHEAWRAKLAGERSGEVWTKSCDGEAYGLCWAIGRLDPEGMPYVIAALDDARSRRAALQALANLRDARIAPTVLRMMRDRAEDLSSEEGIDTAKAVIKQGDGLEAIDAALQDVIPERMRSLLNEELDHAHGQKRHPERREY